MVLLILVCSIQENHFPNHSAKILNFILVEKKGYTEISREDTFPQSRKYQSFYLDLFEHRIINPVHSSDHTFHKCISVYSEREDSGICNIWHRIYCGYIYRNHFKLLALINILISILIPVLHCYPAFQCKSQGYSNSFSRSSACLGEQRNCCKSSYGTEL